MPDHVQPGSNQPDGSLSFEQAYAELEKTAQALQQGQRPLDETLRLYERGSFLAHYCLQKLDEVELKISQLLAHADGTFSTRPIASERDVVAPAVQPLPEHGEEPDGDLDGFDEDLLKEQRELFD